MGRFLRITAIFLIALIGGAASFLIFLVVRIYFEQNYRTISSDDIAGLFICILLTVSAIFAIVFQTKVLSLMENPDEDPEAEIIDQQIGMNQQADFGLLRKLHWSLWSANFAFAVGLICFSLFLLNHYLTTMPPVELPHGWERYSIVLIALMLGIMLVTDTLVLLKNYIAAR